MASLVADRRRFNYVSEWRVGVSSATYSYAGEPSGLGYIEWGPVDDPVVRLPIPSGYFAVKQLIGNYDLSGLMLLRDYEAVTQLLRIIDVDNVTGGTQKAVTWGAAPSLSDIDYLAFTVSNTKVVNDPYSTTAETSSFVFAGNVYMWISKVRWDEISSPWMLKWYADYVTQTDA